MTVSTCSARIKRYVLSRCISALNQDLYRDIVRSGLQNTNNLLFLQNYVYRVFISVTIVQLRQIIRIVFVSRYTRVHT